MTTPASNNRFKGVSFQPQATPATPATGDGRLFLDTSDGLLKWIDDAGTVTEVIGGGGVTDHGALTGLSDDDHTQYVLRSILTTNGDLFTRAAGAVSRLGIGSTGDVLTVSGGAPTWAAPAGGSAPTYAEGLCSSDTTISGANTATDVTGASIALGSGNWFVGASLCVSTPGTATYYLAMITTSGGTILRSASSGPIGNGIGGTGEMNINVSGVKVTGSQTIKLRVQANGTTAKALQTAGGGGQGTYLWAVQVA